jgi:hypothetical protein
MLVRERMVPMPSDPHDSPSGLRPTLDPSPLGGGAGTFHPSEHGEARHVPSDRNQP